MTYRISYGNGQVTNDYDSYAEARRDLESMRTHDWAEDLRIQRYDGEGEWVYIGKAGRLATLTREGL